MEREIIFWFGLFVLTLTMTGGMWMFMESKSIYEKQLAKNAKESIPAGERATTR